ncbi:MAG: hypothetical protein VBE63_08380 [Lamprobacter sp.]|uniref:hypothetical protein n=1 Tax=Lamprobacter sp. TaxID=3100796 RepID=UPI002B259C02|nr:hypothetical protein [Lamprobacter sp.]MEA3639946.1 hypothetical protein [Lamprobacter sp.]
MPNMPCYNDLAARNYAHSEALWEARLDTIGEKADELDAWSLESIRTKLKPHETETLDEIINTVAERMLDELARDNFIEPDWDY